VETIGGAAACGSAAAPRGELALDASVHHTDVVDLDRVDFFGRRVGQGVHDGRHGLGDQVGLLLLHEIAEVGVGVRDGDPVVVVAQPAEVRAFERHDLAVFHVDDGTVGGAPVVDVVGTVGDVRVVAARDVRDAVGRVLAVADQAAAQLDRGRVAHGHEEFAGLRRSVGLGVRRDNGPDRSGAAAGQDDRQQATDDQAELLRVVHSRAPLSFPVGQVTTMLYMALICPTGCLSKCFAMYARQY